MLKVAKKSFVNNTNTKFIELENANYYDFGKKETGKKIIQEMEKVLKKELNGKN